MTAASEQLNMKLSDQNSGTYNMQSQPAIKIDVGRMSSSRFTDANIQSGCAMSYSPSPEKDNSTVRVNSNLQNYEMLTVAIKDIKIKKRDCLRQKPEKKVKKPNLILKHLSTLPGCNKTNNKVNKVYNTEVGQQDITSNYGGNSPSKTKYRNYDRYGTSMREALRQSQEIITSNDFNLQTSRLYLRQPLSRSGASRHISEVRKTRTRKINPIAHELREQINRASSSQFSREVDQVPQNDLWAKAGKRNIERHFETLEQRSPATSFVARNSGIQRILQKTIQEEQCLNFDIFTKSDNIEKLNKNMRTYPVSPSVSAVNHDNSRNTTMARTQQNLNSMRVKPILPQLSHPAQVEEEKSTMNSVISGLSQRNSVADNFKRKSSTSSQGYYFMKESGATTNPLGKHQNKLQQQRQRQYREQMKFNESPTQRNVKMHVNTIRNGGHVTNEQHSPLRSVDSRKLGFARTEQGFYKGMKNFSSAFNSIDIADVDESILKSRQAAVSALSPIEQRFESLDITSQAKVMRITHNETRQDRFISIFDQKKSEMRRKIREQGAVSKSVMLERGIGAFKMERDREFLAIREEEDQESAVGAISVPQLSLKSINKYAQQMNQQLKKSAENSAQKPSYKKTKIITDSSKNAGTRNIDREHVASQIKIDEEVYQGLDEPIIVPGIITIRQPPVLKPYVPPKKVDLEQLEVELAEAAAQREIEAQKRLFVAPISSLLLKIPPSDLSAAGLERNMRKGAMRKLPTSSPEQFSLIMRQQSIVTSIQSQELCAPHDSAEFTSEDLSESNNESSSSYAITVQADEISLDVRESDLEAVDTQTNGYIKQLLVDAKTQIASKKDKENSIVMHGRSLYGFPTIETIEKHNEVIAQQNLENSMGERFQSNPAQLGLAMVDQEKRDEIYASLQRVNSGLDLHAQFLTGDESKKLDDEFAIFRINPLYKKPGAFYNFTDLSDVELQMMNDNAMQFEKMILYQQINKVANSAKVQELRAEHPEYVYYVRCSQDTDLPLPILSHIYGNTLNLANYTLSTGHCQGLNSAAKFLQKNINRVRFDNCGIDDGEMASLLSAFCQFKDFKSIIYRQNELHEEALDGFTKLLMSKIPYHLQELRISACRITPDVTTDLIQAVMEKSSLKQFELSETVLFQDDVEIIAEFLSKSKRLEELVLQGDYMVPSLIQILMETIRENKRLVQLNLAYNNMIDGFSGNNMNKVLETESRVKEQLFSFLSGNKKLMHIDLTATNLSEKAILHILPAIKKAQSLQGVHLSGNPGVTDRVKQDARALLKTHPNEVRTTLNLVKLFSPDTIERYQQQWLREAVKIKHISTGKSLVQNGANDNTFINHGSKMILMRYLSHKEEIPGSGQWQLVTNKNDPCWVCEREMKGYIFWTPGMSEKRSQKLIPLSLGEKRAIFETLEQPASITMQNTQRPVAFIPPPQDGRRARKPDDPIEPVYRQDPVVIGSFTDWKPRKMTPLFDFLQSKEPKETKLDYRSMFDYLKKNFMFGQHSDIEKFEECEAYHLNVIEDAMKKREPEVFFDWQILFEKQLKYKKPFFINSDVARENPNYRDIYVAPVFSRSGRQIFCIQPGDSATTLETYASIIDFRQEDIPDKSVTSDKGISFRKFYKPASVFAKWKTDTEQVRDKCLYEHDFLNWKLERFVKDHEQKAFVERAFYDNFYMLKSCFIEMAAETAWPMISQLGLTAFCQKSGLIDNKNLKIKDIDRMYIAARQEDAQTKQKNIVRFQFFEAVARIGIQRFYNQGKDGCATQSQAIDKTFETIKEHWLFDMWEGWRQSQLYKQPVQDILHANSDSLRKLHKAYQKPRLNYLSLTDSNRMMLDANTGLSDQQVKYCFGMSQMTTCFEREKKSIEGLMQLEFVEFLEMFGRCAYSKFQGSELEELDLAVKVEYMLDDLLPLIGLISQEPEILGELVPETESDDY